ncbi:MAG TPA: uracil-DNA glycosylase family protein [Candidatus Thermoplasmatota archaeon]|nr:uracil-DNA glycosylase family protein [Candidatus Thermoplasmatota archaeon]
MSVLEAAKTLRDRCDALDHLAPYVYNPLRYAWGAHAKYAETFGKGKRRALLVGMNPGPWGMGQTGVPFGDVVYVRDWMGISGEHAQPARAHPKRPVTGFACARREPSGSRLYGWAQGRYGAAPAFFERFFIVNYCPLLFFDEAGKNLTPPQLGAKAVEALETACDAHLDAVVRALAPEIVVGVGRFAEERARRVVGDRARIGRVLHPSPASPVANKGWARQAEEQLGGLGAL